MLRETIIRHFLVFLHIRKTSISHKYIVNKPDICTTGGLLRTNCTVCALLIAFEKIFFALLQYAIDDITFDKLNYQTTSRLIIS